MFAGTPSEVRIWLETLAHLEIMYLHQYSESHVNTIDTGPSSII